MSTHKHIDKICCVVLALVLLLTVWFVNAERFGIQAAATVLEYEERLFDTSFVHTIDIVMDDWEGFLDTCENEEYTLCSVVIDNESCGKVAIRAKGNTSLSAVSSYGNDRYSFKLEFDHYDNANTYYGLDKLSLNNIIQDNTYMKDFLSYQMMDAFGVNAPLCSYAYITVNGEDWGLYLAVEGVEESFLTRNYGNGYGELYKPDSTSMGGGRGNGGNFSMGGRSMRDSDVSLIYTDDEYESYSNIFDNAKTDVTDADKDRLIAALKTINEGGNIESAVDIDKVIRYFIVHHFVCNFDSYTGSMIHNYYLYEEDGMLSMIPWDYNLAFGGMGTMGMGGQSDSATAEVNSPIDSPVSDGDIASRPMIAWIFNSEEYTELYHQYYQQFISEFFDSGYFANLLDSTYELIASYVEQDPTAFCSYEEFTTAVETLREFCLLRAESITGQLEGTIPSTEEGQLADSSSLIDASHLSLTAMGEFSNGGGINPAGNNNNQPPELSASSMNTDNMSTNNGQSANSTDNTTEEQQADNRPEEFSRAAPNNTSPTAATANNQWLWLGICIVVLILGLAIAIKAKHH